MNYRPVPHHSSNQDVRPSLATRMAGWIIQPLSIFRRSMPDRERVQELSDRVMHNSTLREWLLVIAGEAPRVRRALLARAACEFRTGFEDHGTASALEALVDEELLDAVVAELFQRTGLEPLEGSERTGRTARLRLAALGEQLQRAPQMAA